MLHVAQILSYVILNGALYGLGALGLSLVFGVMNYLMIAHGGLIMLAAYTTFWAFFYTHIDPFLFILSYPALVSTVWNSVRLSFGSATVVLLRLASVSNAASVP